MSTPEDTTSLEEAIERGTLVLLVDLGLKNLERQLEQLKRHYFEETGRVTSFPEGGEQDFRFELHPIVVRFLTINIVEGKKAQRAGRYVDAAEYVLRAGGLIGDVCNKIN